MSDSSPIRIATRGSALALAQANLVLAQSRAALPARTFELHVIKTTGDKLQAAALAAGDLPKGLFTKELEEALLHHQADLAVHSLKDLPTDLPAGLRLGAVLARADVRDVLVYRDLDHFDVHRDPRQPVIQSRRAYRPAMSFRAFPPGAVVATSSTRRAAQLLEQRPDLKVVPIRGNVGTRLRKLAEQPDLDATILALAGLLRLGYHITPHGRLLGEGLAEGLAATVLPISQMLPCVGQGAIGIEVRQKDPRLDVVCAALDHAETHQAVAAERAFLQGMGGGCHLAVAAYAQRSDTQLWLQGVSFLASQPRRGEVRGAPEQAVDLGLALARQLQT